MPYVEQRDRNPEVEALNPGTLTFKLWKQVARYLYFKGTSFRTFAEILGALEAIKLELQRRHLGPYEQSKLNTNGDVSPLDCQRCGDTGVVPGSRMILDTVCDCERGKIAEAKRLARELGKRLVTGGVYSTELREDAAALVKALE